MKKSIEKTINDYCKKYDYIWHKYFQESMKKQLSSDALIAYLTIGYEEYTNLAQQVIDNKVLKKNKYLQQFVACFVKSIDYRVQVIHLSMLSEESQNYDLDKATELINKSDEMTQKSITNAIYGGYKRKELERVRKKNG